MDSEELKYLGKFYDELCFAINKISKKTTKSISPIVIFIKTQKKRIIEILKESSLSKYNIDDEIVVENLLKNQLIRSSNKSGDYLITPKGIWEYENAINKYGLEKFLEFIDKEYFNLFKSHERKFDVKEKVVIFGMLATRTLSKESWIDANDEDSVLEHWKEIFDKSREELLSLNIIKQADSEDFWKKFKNDELTSPVFYLLRHMNDLPSKTRSLFKFSGKKQYYLNLSQNEEIFKDDLIFLMNKIFEGKEIDVEQRKEILTFFNEISSQFSVYLFNFDVHKYANPEFDELLREIILFM